MTTSSPSKAKAEPVVVVVARAKIAAAAPACAITMLPPGCSPTFGSKMYAAVGSALPLAERSMGQLPRLTTSFGRVVHLDRLVASAAPRNQYRGGSHPAAGGKMWMGEPEAVAKLMQRHGLPVELRRPHVGGRQAEIASAGARPFQVRTTLRTACSRAACSPGLVTTSNTSGSTSISRRSGTENGPPR